jgi:hypothetical protein
MSHRNEHLLILDGHGNHVTLKTMKKTQKVELNMITLPFHTWHVLQPFDAFYFKPFKTTFRKVKDVAMFKTNHMEPNNITMVGWVDHAIDQSFINKNMKYGFKTTGIWPFNLKAMNNKTQL